MGKFIPTKIALKRSMKQKRKAIYWTIAIATFLTVFIFFDVISLSKSTFLCIFNRQQHSKLESTVEVDVTPFKQTDRFDDLIGYLSEPRNNNIHKKPFEDVIIVHKPDKYNPTIAEKMNIQLTDDMSSLVKFQYSISKQHIYKENDPIVQQLLHDLANFPIIGSEEKDGGTEIKLTIEMPNDTFALFKPMRFPRTQDTLPNHFHFTDFERHTSEIAAFHLDNILGFRHTLPVIGRTINITKDVERFAEDEFSKTFFISPSNNSCFYGTCKVYCDLFHPVCGNPDLLEGSFAAYIPEFEGSKRKHNIHPWRRSYSPHHSAPWAHNDEYCQEIRGEKLYRKGPRLLDLVDVSIFDFLMGNQDRHHYNTFIIFGDDPAPILYDHGRAFGRHKVDDYVILGPLLHCCIIKDSTLNMLLRFQNGEKKLSDYMRESLSKDPLTPILLEHHLIALDRRIELVLKQIRKCVAKKTKLSKS